MKTIAIIIKPDTLPLITELNDGVAPAVEEVPTVYLWRGKDEPASIISMDEMNALHGEKMSMIYSIACFEE